MFTLRLDSLHTENPTFLLHLLQRLTSAIDSPIPQLALEAGGMRDHWVPSLTLFCNFHMFHFCNVLTLHPDFLISKLSHNQGLK